MVGSSVGCVWWIMSSCCIDGNPIVAHLGKGGVLDWCLCYPIRLTWLDFDCILILEDPQEKQRSREQRPDYKLLSI